MAKRNSLTLITVDCLRADHVGFLGYHRPTTPFLDSLAPTSLVFKEAIVTGSPTYYSFPGIMASRYPLALGRETIGLSPNETTLATCLKQAGYHTAAFIAGNPYLTRNFGYDAGFDDFENSLECNFGSESFLPAPSNSVTVLNQRIARACHKFARLGHAYDEAYFRYTSWKALKKRKSIDALRPYPAAEQIVDRACQWLEQAREPFFLWLHFMDAHAPYYPAQEALSQIGLSIDTRRLRYLNSWWNRDDLKASSLSAHLGDVINLYDAGICWVDSQVERLVLRLQALRIWNHSVLALTADHGEEFLDHGGRYHKTSSLAQELIHVPLLIRAPEISGHYEKAPFSLLNLAPTLLDCLEIDAPHHFLGHSYCDRESNPDSIAISECIAGCNNPLVKSDRVGPRLLSLRQDRYEVVLDFRNSTEHLFDLERDPRELHPLPREHSRPIRCRLLEAARKHLADTAESNGELKIAARLRELQLQPRVSPMRQKQSSALVEATV